MIVSLLVKLISAYNFCNRPGHEQCRNPTDSALGRACTNPGSLFPRTTKFSVVELNICSIIVARLSSCIRKCESVHMHQWDSQFIQEMWVLILAWASYYLLSPTILKRLLCFWKICGSLHWGSVKL